MTFYEAALRVLEEAGKPLTHLEITQRSVEKELLSHVGKMPELTMLARLAAMARRPRDRKLQVTAKDTFALTDWMLPEDAVALAATGVPEAHPEEGLPALRPIERHPEPSPSNVRGVGRQGERERERKPRRDEEGRRRRFPPLAEVAFEILQEAASPLGPQALIEKARAKELCGEDLGASQLLYALVEDNQRRIDAGRRPQFFGAQTEGATEPSLSLDPASEAPAADVQQALCKLANVNFENGRAVLRVREERPTAAIASDDLALVEAARHAVKEARRAQARLFRKRLGELELGVFEKAVVKLLHASGFREIRVARRSREGLLLGARRKDGSLELRYAVRLLRGHGPLERRHVQELRRDLGQLAAQVGLICSPGDVRGDARSEAVGQGSLIMLWGGDALSEKFFDAETGVVARTLSLFDVDEGFFAQAAKDADEARARREERHRERDGSESEPGPAPTAEGAFASDAPAAPESNGADEGSDEGDDDEGPEEVGPLAAEGGAPVNGGTEEGGPGGGRRRRRRRRRRRGGRPEGAPGQPGGPGAPQSAAPGGPVAAPSEAGGVAPAPVAAPPSAPAPAPSGGGDA